MHAAPAWQPWRIGLFFAAYFAGTGVLAPYFPLYLEHRGLNAAQIGIVMAVAQGMRILGPTAWGWLADHTTERVRILQFTSVAAAVCFVPVLFPGGFGYVLLTMFAVHFFMTGQIPIAEAMTATQLRGDPQAAARYGRLRAWGSISFVLVVLATGVMLDWAGVGLQPWLVLVFLARRRWPRNWCAMRRTRRRRPTGSRCARCSPKPRVRWFFLSVLLMIFAHGALYTYFSLHLAALGYSKSAIGVFWVLGVIVEIGFFFVQGRIFARVDPFRLLAASFALAALRFAMIAEVAHVIALLVIAQMLHAATFAVHHSASILTIQRWFHGRATARGQALYVSIGYGVGGTAGSLLAAWLWTPSAHRRPSCRAASPRCSAGWRCAGRASTTPCSAGGKARPDGGRRRGAEQVLPRQDQARSSSVVAVIRVPRASGCAASVGRRAQRERRLLVAREPAEQEVPRVARLVGQVELGGQRAAAARRDPHVDVRRAPRIGDRPDGAEVKAAIGLGHGAAVALEVRVALGHRAAGRVVIDGVGVALPDLDLGLRDRVAATVEHAAGEVKRTPRLSSRSPSKASRSASVCAGRSLAFLG
jgi:MFS transporter, PPP family, 3-phenylpropionic acid transporter